MSRDEAIRDLYPSMLAQICAGTPTDGAPPVLRPEATAPLRRHRILLLSKSRAHSWPHCFEILLERWSCWVVVGRGALRQR
jgi:hypothetical protein